MTRARRAFCSMAVADWLALLYLCILNVAVLVAPPGPARTHCLLQVGGLLATFVVCMALVRGEWLAQGFWAGLIYRIGIYGTVQQTYFLFKHLLPVVNSGSLDLALYHLDLRLFGVEPAIWLDRFVTPATTEWFAFFYFCYFFLLAAHVLPLLFGAKDQMLLGEFMLGLMLIVCIGHTGYILVPGFGPYRALPDSFQHPLPSGMWMDAVWSTVRSGGAMKDIFPSLHTATPCFLALFSYRNRERLPFRFTWPLLAFFSVNIIVATMFLRWHYVIDVVAGLCVAGIAAFVSPRVARWEVARRRAAHLGPLVPPFGPEGAPGSTPEKIGSAAA